MTGQHLGDVLLNRPGQRELLAQALAEAGAGRSWTATVDLAFARADGLATMHCEAAPGGSPAGPGGGIVIFQSAPAAPARPGPAERGGDPDRHHARPDPHGPGGHRGRRARVRLRGHHLRLGTTAGRR
jgi:hypothetical protein